MSKAINFLTPICEQVFTAPTIPPAPDSRLFFTAKVSAVDKSAVGLHEENTCLIADLTAEPIDISLQNWRKISVGDSCFSARDEFNQGAGFVAARYVQEAGLACQFCCRPLVFGMAVAVHENDGARCDTRLAHTLQVFQKIVLIERYEDVTIYGDSLVCFYDAFVKRRRQFYLQGKNIRSALVADAQGVCETTGGDKYRPFALALQQRISGHRCAKLDHAHEIARQR